MELTIEQALHQGISAHKEGKLQDAERLYRAILQTQPAHPDANHNLGVLAVSVNKAEAALPLFKTALDANPKIEQFWLSYIDALIKEKQFDNANDIIEQAKKQGVAEEKLNAFEVQLASINKPENGISASPSQEQLSSLLECYQTGRYGDAEKLAQSLTQQFPEHHFGWKVLGVVLKQAGRISESLVASQKTVQLSPQDAEAHNNLGTTLQKLGRLDEAEASYKRAVSMKSDYAEAHSNLGNTLQELGRLDESEASCRQSIALKPDFAQAHYNLGVTLKELGRLDEAEVNYKQAIVLEPNLFEAHNNLGTTLQKLGRLDEAEASYKRAISLKSDYAEAHSNLGNTLKELGRLDESEANYKQAIVLEPDFAQAHYNLGVTLQKLGRLDEAEARYKRAISLKSDYAEAHNNLGITLQKLGRLDEAEASYKRAISLKSDYAEAHNNLGNTLQELGRLDEAEASYTQAIALKPDDVTAFWNLNGIQKTIQSAEHWIDKCLIADTTYLEAKLTKAALKFYQGDRTDFDNLMQSKFKKHAYMRSFSWVFSLPNLPELHFNKFYFFDAIIKKSIISKPFYEFGVWRASSFKYLIKVFKKGYGFDTFTGLPEEWDVGHHIEKEGTYTSDGNVPKIKGGEFIVGKFEDTLPVFFSESRPMASVINFDADLYSSTICALNFSKSVMDKDTILIFDEFIINESWEQDEFKALNEFCSINHYSYEVIAVSFFTQQVAVKLIGI
ncbi:tetratricopeptide repeat protein [Candidatus Njordibacter sp. Uisw_058]|uniref:tetratricopeptide repeat protein n=1 Tax=Candidatus Njordibacter sp. Uisw_058 TaxID=3230974 RepID=UPI003D45D5CE